MNSRGQMLQPAPVIPTLLFLIYLAIMGQIFPNWESLDIVESILVIIGGFVFGFGLPVLYFKLFEKDDKK